MEKTHNNLTTIILICILILGRIYINNRNNQDYFISIINFIGIEYVIYDIFTPLLICFNKRKSKNNLFKKQYKKLLTLNLSIYFFSIGIFIMYIFILMIPYIYQISSCINDVVSLISLGISIESDTISDWLSKRYRNI